MLHLPPATLAKKTDIPPCKPPPRWCTATLPPPQYRWALLSERLGTDCWLKHENHTPVGAFKIRGGLTISPTGWRGALPREVVSATRGNHGQSMGCGRAAS